MTKHAQGMIVRMKEMLDYGDERLRGPFVFRTRKQVAVVLAAVADIARNLESEIDASMSKRSPKRKRAA